MLGLPVEIEALVPPLGNNVENNIKYSSHLASILPNVTRVCKISIAHVVGIIGSCSSGGLGGDCNTQSTSSSSGGWEDGN